MNKRQKQKNLFFRNKKSPFYGVKKGWYKTANWDSDISIHEDIFHLETVLSDVQAAYLCKKEIYQQTYWWLSPSPKNRFKKIKICSKKYRTIKDIICLIQS